MTGRFLNVAGEAVSIGGGEGGPTGPRIFHSNMISATFPVHKLPSDLEDGDVILLFSIGAYRITSTTPSMTSLYDGGTGGLSMTSSLHALTVSGTPPTQIAGTFSGSDGGNTSFLVVIRGASNVGNVAGATPSGSSATALSITAGSSIASPTLGLLLFGTANASAELTVSPTAVKVLPLQVTAGSNRHLNVYQFQNPTAGGVVTATPSGSCFKSGAVVHFD
jgi:hypothetical protein